MTEPLLAVHDLRVSFDGLAAVDGVSFDVRPGEVLAVVGESGSGKTSLALALVDLLPSAAVSAASLRWKGEELGAAPRARRALRGRSIGMVFQDPLTALNPVQPVGRQVAEVFEVHDGDRRRAAWRRAVELLELVGIGDAERRARLFPHELSGGMRQRVGIAIAVAGSPDLLVADEPTTALDVTVQAQVLELLLRLKDELGSAILLITHDLGVVAGTADRVMVLYAGREVERGTAGEVFATPSHPYTAGLLAALPTVDDEAPLVPIPGAPPSLLERPAGCAFHPRCARAEVPGRCDGREPVLLPVAGGTHLSACHFANREEPARA